MEHPEHFRILFWHRLVPLIPLAVLAAILFVSPATAGWSPAAWWAIGGIASAGVLLYLGDCWRTSDVVLDAAGVTLYVGRRKESWPYEKLLKVKQIGHYRVRMCFDSGIPDTHMHIRVDLFDSNGFVDALLDRYAESQGHWLPELPSPDDAPAAEPHVDTDADNPAA